MSSDTRTRHPQRRWSSVREFLSAIRDPFTYRPTVNAYALFGFLWGIPIPVFSVGIACWASGHPFTFETLLEHARHPIQILFLAHPVIFSIVFGAMGSVRRQKNVEIRRLVGELQRHVDELADANEKLKELDTLKNQFMANVTHELKTPLVAIRGYNEAIAEERFGPLTGKQREGLLVAIRNIDRLQGLIEELLEFERIEAGEVHPDRALFDLIPLLQATLKTFQPQIEKKRIHLRLGIPAQATVFADRERIGRVLLNLLSNAVKFSGDDAEIGVEVSAAPDRPVQITLWDRGAGIPTNAQKHLFTRFWQADGSSRRRYGGTGLGLAICKGILDAHGSLLRIESTEGRGTTVTFTLPPSDAAPAMEEPSHAQRQAAHSGGG